MLSPETEARLDRARSAEKSYRPNDEICAKLREKTLVMFVAPAAAGKSFLMNHLMKADNAFSRVPVFTTRERRDDDEPGMFRTVAHDDQHVSLLLDKIEAREVVQYAIHPTTGHMYGTTIEDFSSEFNMLATLSSVVGHLRGLPFKNTFVIGVAVEPATWENRFNQRYPEETAEKIKRFSEAASSLQWLLQNPAVRWIDNSSSQPAKAVQSVITIVKYNNQANPNAARYARQMYESATREP